MHILINTVPISLGRVGELAPGRYFVEDVNAAELMVMAEPGTVQIEPGLSANGHFDAATNWNNKSVLFMRNGGFGDMLFLTPILRHFRSTWPTCKLFVACRRERYAIFEGLGYPDGRIDTPVPVHTASNFDAVVSFEHVVEKATTLHYVDAMADHIGLVLPYGLRGRRCDYIVSQAEREWALKRWPKTDNPRLGLQVRAGVRNRSYPMRPLTDALKNLAGTGWEIGLFGVDGDAGGPPAAGSMRNWTIAKLTFRESVALMATSDVVLGPDSALVHVAGALNIPTVALFGPIAHQLRTAYAPSIHSIQGPGKCAPCNFHTRGGLHFPEHCPSQHRGICEVLERIDPQRVTDAVVRLWKENKK